MLEGLVGCGRASNLTALCSDVLRRTARNSQQQPDCQRAGNARGTARNSQQQPDCQRAGNARRTARNSQTASVQGTHVEQRGTARLPACRERTWNSAEQPATARLPACRERTCKLWNLEATQIGHPRHRDFEASSPVAVSHLFQRQSRMKKRAEEGGMGV
jgi:hypothetical protein